MDCSDIAVVLEQVGGEGVAQRVTCRALGDSRVAHGVLDGALHDGLVKVMATALAGRSVEVEASSRKHPLPGPLAAGVRVFSG